MNLNTEIQKATNNLNTITRNCNNADSILSNWHQLQSEFNEIANEFQSEYSKIKQLQEDYLNSLDEVSQSLKWNENKKSEIKSNQNEVSGLINKENSFFNEVNLFISKIDNVLQITSYFDLIFKSMSGGFVLNEIPSQNELLEWKNNLEKLLQLKINLPKISKWIYEEEKLKDSFIQKLEEYKAELREIDLIQPEYTKIEGITKKDKTT